MAIITPPGSARQWQSTAAITTVTVSLEAGAKFIAGSRLLVEVF